MGEFVRLDVEDGIGTIRLDRPPMNALNLTVQTELSEAAAEAGSRDDIAAVIVYGGEKVFAAGADIKQMQAMSYVDMARASHGLQDFTRALAGIPKPTVAAITGYALGGGCEVALACDFRIAAEDATLGQPEILLGIIPGGGGTQRLVFSGRFVKAAEALAIGLVDEVVPADQVYAVARERMSRYVGGASLALRAAKEAIDRGLDTDLGTGLEIERMLFSALFATEDRSAGMTSFVERGPGKATFSGR